MLEYFTEASRRRNRNAAQTIMKQKYWLMLRNFRNTIEGEIVAYTQPTRLK